MALVVCQTTVIRTVVWRHPLLDVLSEEEYIRRLLLLHSIWLIVFLAVFFVIIRLIILNINEIKELTKESFDESPYVPNMTTTSNEENEIIEDKNIDEKKKEKKSAVYSEGVTDEMQIDHIFVQNNAYETQSMDLYGVTVIEASKTKGTLTKLMHSSDKNPIMILQSDNSVRINDYYYQYSDLVNIFNSRRIDLVFLFEDINGHKINYPSHIKLIRLKTTAKVEITRPDDIKLIDKGILVIKDAPN